MKKLVLIAPLLASLAATAVAEPISPAEGSHLQQQITDRFREAAEADFGSPLAFSVDRLVVQDEFAFVMVRITQANGDQVDLTKAPMFEKTGLTAEQIGAFAANWSPNTVFRLKAIDGEWGVFETGSGLPKDIYEAYLPCNILSADSLSEICE